MANTDTLPLLTDKLPLLADIVFRRLFEDTNLLCALVNDLLHREGDARILSLQLAETQQLPTTAEGKASVLDIIATCADGTMVTIEIQLSVRPSYVNRIVYYLMQTGSRRLKRGKSYAKLRPLIAIHILNEPLLPEDTSGGDYHSIFELRQHRTGRRLTDLLAVHVIELPRLRAAGACSTTEEKWLQFLMRGHTMSHDEIAALNVPAIELAEQRLREISADWNLHIALMQREKAERDSYSFLIDARDEGLKEGRTKGLDEGKRLGLDEGKRLGLDEGQRAERRAALLQLLELRGLAPSPAQRARILACADLGQLNAWFAQAVHCQSADELR